MSDSPVPEREEWAPFIGADVVLDTRGDLMYIGKLDAVGDWFVTLVECDVHDLESTRTSKEVYIMEAAKLGVKKNRRSVAVRKSEVVSLSRLDEVIIY